jgi:hypothetical protein
MRVTMTEIVLAALTLGLAFGLATWSLTVGVVAGLTTAVFFLPALWRE